MGESLLLITLITLIILTIRRAKPVVLDNPLVIARPGQYHLTFASQLNQAQRFVEAVAAQFRESGEQSGDLTAQYFEVRDPKVQPKDADHYLLAIAQRDGILYIQAINPPQQLADNLKAVREFSEKQLASHPMANEGHEAQFARLTKTVESVAAASNIAVVRLSEVG
ncbi:MAG: hypothetical protein PHH47_02325 [Gallionella sp.]|nr:hypothetical protein [Gallionella sp.]MDD4947867.1 hypothetical protein [Gallionella sp.]MDD5612638.1 hypothetical protein [Gallionella sp.]